jgi:MazG family protein
MAEVSGEARSAGTEFARLVELVAALRSPEGCPWDREQTLRSLIQFVLEEAYEVVDAIERGDVNGLREEIGDHVFEAVFLARIAADAGEFSIADALRVVTAKLIRRHPHVFTTDGRVHDAASRERAPSAEAALGRWDAQKAEERRDAGATSSALAGLPRGLPALLRALKLGRRAASAGFDWTRAADVVDKVEEETREIRQVLDGGTAPDRSRAEEEVGDLLFAVANLARKLDIDPEAALRAANDKFTARFTALEQRVAATGRSMQTMSLADLEAEWQAVKAGEPVKAAGPTAP